MQSYPILLLTSHASRKIGYAPCVTIANDSSKVSRLALLVDSTSAWHLSQRYRNLISATRKILRAFSASVLSGEDSDLARFSRTILQGTGRASADSAMRSESASPLRIFAGKICSPEYRERRRANLTNRTIE